MTNYNNLVVFKNKNNGLEIKNFNSIKNKIQQALNSEYRTFEILNLSDYERAKNYRAELNKSAKEINDNKIAWVKTLTSEAQNQTKIICEIIKTKSKEYDDLIKNYETHNFIGAGVKKKTYTYEMTIKFESQEEAQQFLDKMPKKYQEASRIKEIKQN
jgi:hypothetical protein